MDTKNVIAAISLSAAVIILYSLFFAPPVVEQENISNDIKAAVCEVVSESDLPLAHQSNRSSSLMSNRKVFGKGCKINGVGFSLTRCPPNEAVCFQANPIDTSWTWFGLAWTQHLLAKIIS